MSDTSVQEAYEIEVGDTETANRYLANFHECVSMGNRMAGIEALEAAYAADPDNIEICFLLAYQLDLLGEEEEAIHLYEQAVQAEHPALNVLINLAVLYEDRGQYNQAERCLRQVLATDPNHERARLYMKDILASQSMIIDDEEDRRLEKQHALLDTPVTDFDLSVRSRNALRKMNIRTLGDLLRVSEAELRSFKNFGDASLDEIKSMLAQRGLRLGQAVEQQQSAAKQVIYDQLQPEGEPTDERLLKTVAELNFSVRARKALSLLSINTVAELVSRTEAELMGVKNFGMTSLLEINERLAEIGLGLRQLDH